MSDDEEMIEFIQDRFEQSLRRRVARVMEEERKIPRWVQNMNNNAKDFTGHIRVKERKIR